MPWTKRSDDTYRDLALADLSSDAYRLRDLLLARAGEVYQTEGHLTPADLRLAVSLLGWPGDFIESLVEELVSIGFMYRLGAGWQINDFAERYGRTAEAIDNDRKRQREKKQRQREKGRLSVVNGADVPRGTP